MRRSKAAGALPQALHAPTALLRPASASRSATRTLTGPLAWHATPCAAIVQVPVAVNAIIAPGMNP